MSQESRSLPARLKGALIRYLNAIFDMQESQRDLVGFLQTESWRNAIKQPPYDDPKRLAGFGYKVYSQSDEDGMIAEIFRRIGTKNQVFFEFGVGDGLANNTVNLLISGWSGFWIEGSANFVKAIHENLRDLIQAGRLKVLNEFITKDSINSQITRLEMPSEIDLLSIDIDGNDYWIWKAIDATRARVVVIEYNAALPPPVSVTIPYAENHQWNGTNYMGSSLVALEKLGREKGYSLVACNYTGVNAFFVRDDLLGDHFAGPFASSNHYEPPRYLTIKSGHPPGIGPYVQI